MQISNWYKHRRRMTGCNFGGSSYGGSPPKFTLHLEQKDDLLLDLELSDEEARELEHELASFLGLGDKDWRV